MDSLTQIVLGAAVGEAVLGRKVGNKAVLYGAIAGTIPDLDTFASYFTDTITAIEWHRSLTHSIIFALLAAPLFGFLISKIERKSGVGWQDWTKLMFWGLFTHPLLDCFTTWGTQLFWPLETEIAIKSIFVIDPLYTVPFLIFLILAMRQPKGSPKRRKYNRLGLLISSGYLVLSLIFKSIAFQNFTHSLEQQGIFYERIEVRPSPFNIILWNANVEVDDAFLTGDYSLFDDEMVRFEAFPKNHHYLGRLRDNKNILRLIEISNGWFIITEENGQLFFNDLRFGQMDPEDPESWVFSYRLVEDNGKVMAEEVEKSPEDGQKILSGLWERIKGN